jgi:hypothetical protein
VVSTPPVASYTSRDQCDTASGTIVDRIDKRVWYVVAAVVVVLLLAWFLGWFGGTEVPAPTPAPTTTPQ